MKQRMMTWATRLALLAAVRKLMKTTSQKAGYEETTVGVTAPSVAARVDNAPSAPAQRSVRIPVRTVTVTTRRKKTEPVKARRRAEAPARNFTLPDVQLPWEPRRRFMLPWQRRRGLALLLRQLPWQRRRSRLDLVWPLLLGAALGAGLVFLITRRRNGDQGQEYDYTRLRGTMPQPPQLGHAPAAGTGGFGAAAPQSAAPQGAGAQGAGAQGATFGDRTGQLNAGLVDYRGGLHGPQPGPSAQGDDAAGDLSRTLHGQYEWQTGGGEIVRDQWDRFCEIFGEQQRGKRVTITAKHGDGSESIIATDQPLLTLSNEQDAAGFALRLVLGSDETETLGHNVTGVESMRLQTGAAGEAEELLVRTADGTTSVRFA